MEKPPLGVMPQYLWDEKRMVDLTEAIERYKAAGTEYPKEWYVELAEVTLRVAKMNAARAGQTLEEYMTEVREISNLLGD